MSRVRSACNAALDVTKPLDYHADYRCRDAGYGRRAERLFSAAERAEIVEYLAASPRAGDVMQGTGGVRKLRWARRARQGGGVRVIYYFHGEAMPLYLLTVFGKNEKANLSKAERNDPAKLAGILKTSVERNR
jgi:hypothetical protein